MSVPQVESKAPLSPLVDRHRAGIDVALRGLLGLPDAIPLRWRQSGSYDAEGWVYVVTVGGAATTLGLELSAAAIARPAAFRGKRLHLAHRSEHAADDPVWASLLRRIRAIDAGAGDPLLQALLQAQQIFAPFSAREDADYHSFAANEALLRVGFRCNQDCSFCWQGRDWAEPDQPTLERWLDEMAARGAKRIVLSGGEPTVYLDKVLALARRSRDVHGLPAFIQTNAIRLSQPHVLQALQEAGVVGALTSYHSADAALSDAMTRAPGTHARTEAGIRAAVAAGMIVDLNVVVERRTLPGLLARSQRIVAEFASLRRRREQMSASFSFPTDYQDPEVYTREVAPLDEVAPLLAGAIRTLQDADIHVSPVGSCGFPLCVLAEIPSSIDLEVLDDLAGEHLRSRISPPICDACALRNACVGPRREYLERHGERGLRPFQSIPAALVDEMRRRGLDLPRHA